jgi:hypothetical protein
MFWFSSRRIARWLVLAMLLLFQPDVLDFPPMVLYPCRLVPKLLSRLLRIEKKEKVE